MTERATLKPAECFESMRALEYVPAKSYGKEQVEGVWFMDSHECLRRIPFSKEGWDISKDGEVKPSVLLRGCGWHAFIKLDAWKFGAMPGGS